MSEIHSQCTILCLVAYGHKNIIQNLNTVKNQLLKTPAIVNKLLEGKKIVFLT